MKHFIIIILFLLIISVRSFAKDKPLGDISFVMLGDFQGLYNRSSRTNDYSKINLAEIRTGLHWKVSELIAFHGDILLDGNPNDGYNIGPGYVFGEIFFSKRVPIFLKAGKWELFPVQGKKITVLVTDNYVLEAGKIDTVAGELGFHWEWLRLGGGLYMSKSTPLGSPNKSNDINNFFGYATVKKEWKNINLFLNLGWLSHLGDTTIGTNYRNSSGSDFQTRVGALIFEMKVELFSRFQFFFSSIFRLKDDDNFYTKNAFHWELSWLTSKKYPLTLTIFGDYRTLPSSVKNNYTYSSSRAGGMVAYQFYQSVRMGLEGWQGFYDRSETRFTLQLLIEIPDHRIYREHIQ